MAVTALQRLLEAMHAALGKPGPLRHAPNALLTVVTKTLENAKTFVTKSHVGLFSAG